MTRRPTTRPYGPELPRGRRSTTPHPRRRNTLDFARIRLSYVNPPRFVSPTRRLRHDTCVRMSCRSVHPFIRTSYLHGVKASLRQGRKGDRQSTPVPESFPPSVRRDAPLTNTGPREPRLRTSFKGPRYGRSRERHIRDPSKRTVDGTGTISLQWTSILGSPGVVLTRQEVGEINEWGNCPGQIFGRCRKPVRCTLRVERGRRLSR